VRRVLAADGVVWLNLGDSYAASTKGSGGTAKSGLMRDGRKETQQLTTAAVSIGHQMFSRRRFVLDTKPKDLLGIPWRVAFALQEDGWYLRSDTIWSKPNPMPESVTDRPTRAHEYLFLLAKSERYHYDAPAIFEPYAEQTLKDREADRGFYDGEGTKDYAAAGVQNPSDTKRRIAAGIMKKLYSARPGIDVKGGGQGNGVIAYGGQGGRNKRSVWTIPTMPYAGAHFATMPEALVEPCILAGCPVGGLVLDPFLGSGTVGAVAERLGRRWVGTDLSYQPLASARTAQRGLRW